MREVDLAQADLTDGFFRGCDFSGSRFLNTDLTRADFRGATNYGIGAQHNILKNTRFSLPEAMALLYGLDILLDDD